MGVLSDHLAGLDIPNDGTVRLVSVNTELDDNGTATWTVKFKRMPGKVSATLNEPTPVPSHVPRAATPAAAAVGRCIGADDMAAPLASTDKSMALFASAEPQLPTMDRLFPMKCSVKNYPWGRFGEDSLVARLAAKGLNELDIMEGSPYGELWMGTHPSGPSMVMLQTPWKTITPLSDWIKLNPALLGPRKVDTSLQRRKSMIKMEANSLPFLFKILSVRTALSIQAHPDKALATKLHATRPDVYKDDNHKPEMAVAITRFEGLCSFQPAYSILSNCRATPELMAVVGETTISELEDAAGKQETSPDLLKAALRKLYEALMTASNALVEKQLLALVKRVESTSAMLRVPVDVLAVRLHEQYPGDVGVFSAYLLNYCCLEPGEALFLAANEPHAYISGECAEVMATSDNVVRAGCTPKYKDVETLVNMLTYKVGTPHYITPTQQPGAPFVWRYTTPVEEFMMERVELPLNGRAELPAVQGLSVLIVVKGSATAEQLPEGGSSTEAGLVNTLEMGAVMLICPSTVLKLHAAVEPLLLFRSGVRQDDYVEA